MRQKAFRSFPNRYPFSLYYEVISSFSIRYNLEIILQCNSIFATLPHVLSLQKEQVL